MLTIRKEQTAVGGKTYTNIVLECDGLKLAIKPQFENYANTLKLLEIVGKEESK